MKDTAKKILKQAIPESQHGNLRQAYERVKYFGRSRYCPVCQSYARKFKPFGVDPRPDAMCPFCGSLERHRLDWVFFHDHTDLFDRSTTLRMLHIAPGPFAEALREEESIDYLSGDIDEEKAMEKVDVTGIQYPDGSFDVIYASHVLEHVPEDKKAMHELHRVLEPEGWAVLQVPITAEETFEDPSVTDPEERERLFGQWNHVRRYGPDYKDRLEEAGFEVTKCPAPEVVGRENVERMGITENEDVYFCEKS
ncbi:class I SAM-dependent methyltransferase [Salinibacter ruber]|uniref:class I SAM-dependent methyltransferase n=1 Tax=Salinibacter ruber TaxID=146919 RepID=UPI000E582C35|nr:methyltransferase domain-containing protein [Salinibacter ruber]